MKAAILYEAGKPLVVEDGVTVDAPGKNEVKVRIAVTAVCHSDLHFFKGDIPAKLPGLAGHEVAGYIDEVGENVTGFKPGDHVVVGTVTSGCGHCYYCTIGLRHFCTNRGGPGPGHHMNSKSQRLSLMAGPVGGFAEYTTVAQGLVTKIPEDMPLDKASLLACGVTSGFGAVVNRAQVKPFNSVVVIGTGGVGLNSIQGARFSGAYPIIAVDILDSKLEFARKFGATHTINLNTEKDPVGAVKKIASGRGADFAIITVGSVSAIRQGFDMCGPRGMTVVVGLAQGNLSSFTAMDLIMGERVLTGSGGGSIRPSIDIPGLIALYKNGQIKLDELITARYPLEKINEAVDSLDQGKAIRNLIMFE
ncbi:MAG: alcohol dehydrogenase catalytic domain-containing protein [Dehalococcoidales bacterium]|nr:alcohol dehydrogenase catalytic domain-containing protein [Dehalococcoidales bacterium]